MRLFFSLIDDFTLQLLGIYRPFLARILCLKQDEIFRWNNKRLQILTAWHLWKMYTVESLPAHRPKMVENGKELHGFFVRQDVCEDSSDTALDL